MARPGRQEVLVIRLPAALESLRIKNTFDNDFAIHAPHVSVCSAFRNTSNESNYERAVPIRQAIFMVRRLQTRAPRLEHGEYAQATSRERDCYVSNFPVWAVHTDVFNRLVNGKAAVPSRVETIQNAVFRDGVIGHRTDNDCQQNSSIHPWPRFKDVD